MSRITLQQLTKSYPGRRGREVRAIDRVTLDIAPGEWLSVVGPSGSGKTTLLRVMAALEAPTAGAMQIDGEPAPSDPAALNFAMVFQRDALLPQLTARENIALGLRLRGLGRAEIEQRLGEVEGILNLGAALDRLPRALSGGERQRAALARAWVLRPRALLLDEPLSALDPPLRAQCRAAMKTWQRRLGATVVHVTHDQNEAMALGDRVAVLRRGVVHQVGTPATLYASPADAFVAGFIGSPPFNLFRGRLAPAGGALWFHAAGPAADGAGLSLCLTETQGASLQERGRAGGEIVVGLRPEGIHDGNARRSVPHGCEVRAEVVTVENMGADVHVRWRAGSAEFVQHIPSERWSAGVAVGSRHALVFDLAGARFFDPATEAALSLGDSCSSGHA